MLKLIVQGERDIQTGKVQRQNNVFRSLKQRLG